MYSLVVSYYEYTAVCLSMYIDYMYLDGNTYDNKL